MVTISIFLFVIYVTYYTFIEPLNMTSNKLIKNLNDSIDNSSTHSNLQEHKSNSKFLEYKNKFDNCTNPYNEFDLAGKSLLFNFNNLLLYLKSLIFDNNPYYTFGVSDYSSIENIDSLFHQYNLDYNNTKISHDNFNEIFFAYHQIKYSTFNQDKKSYPYGENMLQNFIELSVLKTIKIILIYCFLIYPTILIFAFLFKIFTELFLKISIEIFFLIYIKFILFQEFFPNLFSMIIVSIVEALICYFYPGNLFYHITLIIKQILEILRIGFYFF